jgi:hypothetical protein
MPLLGRPAIRANRDGDRPQERRELLRERRAARGVFAVNHDFDRSRVLRVRPLTVKAQSLRRRVSKRAHLGVQRGDGRYGVDDIENSRRAHASVSFVIARHRPVLRFLFSLRRCALSSPARPRRWLVAPGRASRSRAREASGSREGRASARGSALLAKVNDPFTFAGGSARGRTHRTGRAREASRRARARDTRDVGRRVFSRLVRSVRGAARGRLCGRAACEWGPHNFELRERNHAAR